MEPCSAGLGCIGLQGSGAQMWGMPCPLPLRYRESEVRCRGISTPMTQLKRFGPTDTRTLRGEVWDQKPTQHDSAHLDTTEKRTI